MDAASTSRVVWTPAIRKQSLTSNTFFAASEFAGVLNSQRGLSNVLPCVMAPAEEEGGETTFNAQKDADGNVVPGGVTCVDATGRQVQNLKDVKGEILIVAHGNAMYPKLDIGFGADGTELRESFTADEVANMLVQDGLACDHHQITLIIVRGGLRLSDDDVKMRYLEIYKKIEFARRAKNKDLLEDEKNEWAALAMRQRSPNVFENNDDIGKQEVPFAVNLAFSLKQKGFLDIRVNSFKSEMKARLGSKQPTRYGGLKLFITTKDVTERYCKHRKSKLAREKCVDNLMAPCDNCLLTIAGQGTFEERVASCRETLRQSKDKYDRKAAKICRVETKPVRFKDMFSVHSSKLPGQ
jgi:hypothetical protein